MAHLRRVSTTGLLLLVLAAGCGDDSPYAGLKEEEASRAVRSEVERALPVEKFSRFEAAKTKTPSGVEAWLVKVVHEGESGDVCGYVRRDDQGKTRIEPDSGCLHWKY